MAWKSWQVPDNFRYFIFFFLVLNVSGLREEKVVEAHGSFSSASCIQCKAVYSMEKLREEIMTDRDPTCPKCGSPVKLTAIFFSRLMVILQVKPNIVFFGEQLPQRFFDEAEIECLFSDLLICMGTSLEVYPFAGDQLWSRRAIERF